MSIEHDVIKQIAYVVDDLDTAIEDWVRLAHAGPFFRIDDVQVEGVRYRGVPADAKLSIALGNSGGVQIELIQQRDGGPSIYRERRGGVHHLAMLARDFDGES